MAGMEERNVQKIIEATHWPRAAAATALGMLALFLLVATAGELRSYKFIGSGITPSDTVTVSGEGDVLAVPDTAQFSFMVQNTAADVATAQAVASKSENAILDYLKSQGVADADVQTTDYEINPQYEYQNAVCPQPAGVLSTLAGAPNIYCPPGKQTLTGYQVSETISVKVHDTSKAGALLSGIGGKGASNVSGLSFTSSNQDQLQNQARDKAIADAKTKAQALAKSLGVSLVRIVSFNENNGPIPYYAKAVGMSADSAAAPAPQLPTGENKITSNVTITYEIQ